MEVSNQGKSVGILSAAPNVDGFSIGGPETKEFSISASTTNDKFESNSKIYGATNEMSQGILNISTQGSNSNGDVTRGTINLVADSINLNAQPLTPRAWVLYENGPESLPTWGGNVNAWYTNTGLFKHIEGPDHTGYWEYDKSTGMVTPLVHGIWYLVNSVAGVGTQSNMAAIFNQDNVEVCTAVAPANLACTAVCHYLYTFGNNYNIGDVGWYFKAAHSGNIRISRRVTFGYIIYLGPAQ